MGDGQETTLQSFKPENLFSENPKRTTFSKIIAAENPNLAVAKTDTLIYNPAARPQVYIAVCGPIGVGKTIFCRYMAQSEYGIKKLESLLEYIPKDPEEKKILLLEENIEENSFFNLFSKDETREEFKYPAQMKFLENRIRQQDKARAFKYCAIEDRMVREDWVFAKTNLETSTKTGDEFLKSYKFWAERYSRMELLMHDMVIFLQVDDLGVLNDNIKKRARGQEVWLLTPPGQVYLTNLNYQYLDLKFQLLTEYGEERVLVVNAKTDIEPYIERDGNDPAVGKAKDNPYMNAIIDRAIEKIIDRRKEEERYYSRRK